MESNQKITDDVKRKIENIYILEKELNNKIYWLYNVSEKEKKILGDSLK